MSKLETAVPVLLAVGGINLGLIGLAETDVVAYLPSILAKVVYVLVGLAALYSVYTLATK